MNVTEYLNTHLYRSKRPNLKRSIRVIVTPLSMQWAKSKGDNCEVEEVWQKHNQQP